MSISFLKSFDCFDKIYTCKRFKTERSSFIFELCMLKYHEIARNYNKYPRNSKLFWKNKKFKIYEEPNISRDNEY